MIDFKQVYELHQLRIREFDRAAEVNRHKYAVTMSTNRPVLTRIGHVLVAIGVRLIE